MHLKRKGLQEVQINSSSLGYKMNLKTSNQESVEMETE